MTKNIGHILGGSLLVTGISIGVGMLALPVATAQGGFLPSLAIYALCWLFMLCTGLLILETCIWMPKDANLISLASHLLGKGGKVFCWILYLYLFSCLMVAHVAGAGDVVSQITAQKLPYWGSILLYVALFSPAVYLGTKSVDRLNILLMIGVAITYLMFVFSSFHFVNFSQLQPMNWNKAWWALPVVFTAFGYQSLIPTLMTYMNRNVRQVKLAIIFGTGIPFLIYVIWEWLILGIIPLEGQGGLAEALRKGQNAVAPLGQHLNNPSILSIGRAFAFFTLTTSYVGIAIAFVDFLADGLKIEKKGLKKLGLCALVFLVPTVIALIDPSIFLTALSYAGGIGVALLLGAMPILMVWSGRYRKGFSLENSQLPGGKFFLIFLMAFVIFELIIQFMA